jgi:NAD(P)-dependent dehydrogenase (short-subunit alcohol dehydrogenase family)
VKNNNWTAEDIPDLTSNVAIVTGANSGIGKETAKQLALKNAIVILAVRNIESGQHVVNEILQEAPGTAIEVMQLDLSSLASVQAFAASFLSRHKKLDILVNNAGVMVPPYGKTEDGFELQMGTNHLGHFALTGLLLPALQASDNGRIVTVSSLAHRSGNIDFADLHWEERDYNASRAYADSKIANLYFTLELSKRFADTSMTVVAAHPGWTRTNLQKNHLVFRILNPLFSQKPPMGALPSLRAATDPSVQNGDYYGPGGFGEIKGNPIKVDSIELANDLEVAKKLWIISEQLTGVSYVI